MPGGGKVLNPGAALARLCWANATEAGRDEPREAGQLGGRPRTPTHCRAKIPAKADTENNFVPYTVTT